MKSKIIAFFKAHKKASIVGVIVVVATVALVLISNRNGSEAGEHTIKKGTYVKSVKISGKVVAAEKVDLAFDTNGVVLAVYKDAGDSVLQGQTIAALDSREIQAERAKAEADYTAEKAELDKLKFERVGEGVLVNKKTEVVNAIINAHTTSAEAIRNNIDDLFDYPDSLNPQIKYNFDDHLDREKAINRSRVIIGRVLNEWGAMADSLTAENYTEQKFNVSKTNLIKVRNFIDEITNVVIDFDVDGSLSESEKNEFRENMYASRQNINAAMEELTSTHEDIQIGSGDVVVQESRVRAALATIERYDAQIAKSIIRAPFTGVISAQNAKVGQSVSANSAVSSLISSGFEIEAYVPEVSISGIEVGKLAQVTLDAYPGEKFEVFISHVDPAETLKDGVSNYKIKLAFNSNDPRIRPGMTADVAIEVDRKENVLLVPLGKLKKIGGTFEANKKEGDELKKVTVEVKGRDDSGNAEIISGLAEDDVIVSE